MVRRHSTRIAGGVQVLKIVATVTIIAAALGYAVAQSASAEDPAQALAWYRKAAAGGNTFAMYRLGFLYATGTGTPQNLVQAVAWYRKSAEAGDARGEEALGEMYQEGRGVTQDYAQAMKWFRMAADAKNGWAEWQLGRMYEYGWGTAANRAQALVWYRQAAALGISAAKRSVKALEDDPSASRVNVIVGYTGPRWSDSYARATVLQLLQQALVTHVRLSVDDIHKLGLRVEDINETIKKCNNNRYEERVRGVLWETAETYCSALGETIWPEGSIASNRPSLGPDNPAVEAAFARACALPIVDGVREVAEGCASLSQLFQVRNQLELALAIVQYAPKCQGRPRAEAEIHPIDPDQSIDSTNGQLESCLWQESRLLRVMERPQEERVVYKALCDAADEAACADLAELGVQVNVKAAEERQASLQAAAQSRADADSAARAQARAEGNANFQNLMNTLHSMPGGSDSNAIVNTANQQAANIVALGAAAARSVTEQRREQAATQAAAAASTSAANSTTTNSSAIQSSWGDSSESSTYTYVQPATDCLSYAANQNTNGLLVTNNCKDSVVLTWARPTGTGVGLDYAIQGGVDNVAPGGSDSIPPKPVRVFACHEPGTPTKPGHESASNGWMPEYTDTSFTCPALNQAVKKQY